MTPIATTNTPKPLDRFAQHTIVQRIANSDLYRRVLGDSRQQAAERRATLVRDLSAGIPAEEKRKEAAGRAFNKAEAEAEAMRAAEIDARNARTRAWLEMESARCTADKRRSRITAELEHLADPRIEDLVLHLQVLEEAARHCTRPVLDHVTRDWLGRERLSREWNTDAVSNALATLRGLLDELRALKLADYGADCRARLVAVLARAEAVCEPIGVYDEGRIARHVIED